MPKQEMTPEQKAASDARKAARDKLKADPKYNEMREVVRFTMEDIVEEMAASDPPDEDENPFDYIARKMRGD
jgi:hypothetical protein